MCNFIYVLTILLFHTSVFFAQNQPSNADTSTAEPKFGIQSYQPLQLPMLQWKYDWRKLSDMDTRKPYYNSIMRNFQNSTAYQFDWAKEVLETGEDKREYGNYVATVPVMPIIVLSYYGAKYGYDVVRKDPPIDFDNTDLQLMALMWLNPGKTDVRYYEMLNEAQPNSNVTYMIVKKRLATLKQQKVVRNTDIGVGKTSKRYVMKYSKDELKDELLKELQSQTVETADRYSKILQLLDLLEE